jgi:hypothetical protein
VDNPDFIVPVEIDGTVHQVSILILALQCKLHFVLLCKLKSNNIRNSNLCAFFVLKVYVLKRPHVDEFLRKMGELFECVLFTASLSKVCRSDYGL